MIIKIIAAIILAVLLCLLLFTVKEIGRCEGALEVLDELDKSIAEEIKQLSTKQEE